jgi:hypothetical protein
MFKVWIRLIAILEIMRGVFGIAFELRRLFAYPTDRHAVALSGIVFAVYLLSLVAGIAL